jgi:hypothetical protein
LPLRNPNFGAARLPKFLAGVRAAAAVAELRRAQRQENVAGVHHHPSCSIHTQQPLGEEKEDAKTAAVTAISYRTSSPQALPCSSDLFP